MGRITALTTGALLGVTLLSGLTDAHLTADVGTGDGSTLLSDSFAGYAASTPIGVGGRVSFARGTVLKVAPPTLARPISVQRTAWRT